MNNTYSVYLHIFPNGKVYVGITKFKPEYRWNNGNGYKRQPYVYKAILKYGWVNIKHEILEANLSESEAKNKEKFYIKAYKSNDKRYGYNLTSGGELPSTGVKRVVSIETRIKISNSQKGRKRSKESIEKSVNGRKGYKHNDVTKRKIADATKIPILQFSLNDEFICEYESILSASQNTNVAKQNICKCCKGNRQTAGGYKWKYKIYGSAHKKEV